MYMIKEKVSQSIMYHYSITMKGTMKAKKGPKAYKKAEQKALCSLQIGIVKG